MDSQKNGRGTLTPQPLQQQTITKSDSPQSYPVYASNGRRLPSTGAYARAIGMRLHHFNEWKKADCPFCAFKKAFLIRPLGGAYRCTACGAHGSGLIQLHAELYGLDFSTAMNELAALADRG